MQIGARTGLGDTPVTSCAGCGACCAMQGGPPDYVALRLHPALADDPTFTDDALRLAHLPSEARDSLERYLAETAGETPTTGVCVWYDPDLARCAHYEWRPSTCRVFELDGPGCHIYRRLRGIAPASTGSPATATGAH